MPAHRGLRGRERTKRHQEYPGSECQLTDGLGDEKGRRGTSRSQAAQEEREIKARRVCFAIAALRTTRLADADTSNNLLWILLAAAAFERCRMKETER